MPYLTFLYILSGAKYTSRVVILRKYHKWVGPDKLAFFPPYFKANFPPYLSNWTHLWSLLKITTLLFYLALLVYLAPESSKVIILRPVSMSLPLSHIHMYLTQEDILNHTFHLDSIGNNFPLLEFQVFQVCFSGVVKPRKAFCWKSNFLKEWQLQEALGLLLVLKALLASIVLYGIVWAYVNHIKNLQYKNFVESWNYKHVKSCFI